MPEKDADSKSPALVTIIRECADMSKQLLEAQAKVRVTSVQLQQSRGSGGRDRVVVDEQEGELSRALIMRNKVRDRLKASLAEPRPEPKDLERTCAVLSSTVSSLDSVLRDTLQQFGRRRLFAMQIFVRHVKTSVIRLLPEDTIGSLKEQLEQRGVGEKGNTHLSFKGQFLDDDLRVCDCGIQSEDTLIMELGTFGATFGQPRQKKATLTAATLSEDLPTIDEALAGCQRSLDAYKSWFSRWRNPAEVTLTDVATAQARTAASDSDFLNPTAHGEGASAAVQRLTDRFSELARLVKEEESFWNRMPPLCDTLPIQSLYLFGDRLRRQLTAIKDQLKALLAERDELVWAEKQLPEDGVRAMQQAQDELKIARRALRGRLQTHQDALEDGEPEEMIKDADLQVQSARGAVKSTHRQVIQAMLQLVQLEPQFPEVLRFFQAGLPAEVLHLWRPGWTLATYENLELLGNASRNRVFKATLEGRTCAVKEFAVTTTDLHACFREARLLYRLQHPAVVQLEALFFEEQSGSSPARLCLQMPFYEHGPVDAWLLRCQPGANALRRVMLGVLEALAHLHAHGVVHADVKPANILIASSGRPRLADFDTSIGSCTLASATAARSLQRAPGGTFGFRAPELDDTGPSEAADMYAFGATLRTLAYIAKFEDDEACAALIARLMVVEPDQRLKALPAMQAAYFAPVWSWQSVENRQCIICLETRTLQDGLECADVAAHFLCSDCLAGHVCTEAGKELRLVAACEGRIRCPEPSCSGVTFDDVDLARKVPAHAFEKYLACRQKVLEAQLAREMEAAMQTQLRAELQRLANLDELRRAVLLAVSHIQEEILTLKCPRCEQAFCDFDGCLALTCSRCSCRFCGWCLKDCGKDAHRHVRTCPEKRGKDPFFATMVEFKEAVKLRQRGLVTAFLATLRAEVRRKVEQDLHTELAEIGYCPEQP
eukprot:TRINITY_DN23079_c0_g1_i1.p1 TRINITY_DN23079_c0_g1~~TRINITY_DN23079_c0_g1_i1.p1  ORF type:complete len:1105 (+),score=171.44 TRINITY_DN23079_c0_g1_i1:479-3316(+)